MRDDEMYATARVAAYLGGSVEVIPGEDPPDCFFIYEGRKYAVEITQLHPVSYDVQGFPKNRTTEDDFSIKACDALNRIYGNRISNGLNLCLTIHGPIRQPRKFKQSIEEAVSKAVCNGYTVEDWRDSCECSGNRVDMAVFGRESPTGRKIVGIISNEDAQPQIQIDATVILTNRIAVKEQKMSGISWTGPRWLILLNVHRLATVSEFATAYRKITVAHGFERVFFVDDGGDVTELSRVA